MSYQYQRALDTNNNYNSLKYLSAVGQYSYKQSKPDTIIENNQNQDFCRSRQFLSKSNYTPYQNIKRIPSSLNSLRQTYDPSMLTNKTNQFKNSIQSSLQKSSANYLRNTIDYPISMNKNSYCFQENFIKNYSKCQENPIVDADKRNYDNQIQRKIEPDQSSYRLDYSTLKQKLIDNARLINQLKALKQQRKAKQQANPIFIKQNRKKLIQSSNQVDSINTFKSWGQIGKDKVQKFNPPYKTTKQLPINEKKVQINQNCSGFYVNNFKLSKKLGGGKFGTVFCARHIPTGAIFAVKQVSKNMIKNNSLQNQFLLEIKLQSILNHGNIVKIYGIFDDKEHIYLILQYMEDGTLFSYMKKKLKLTQNETAIKVREVSEAVNYMHDEGIAHRDIKPENIVMTHNVCKLCDFGWATVCDQRRKTYCGTFDYAAPQILQGIQYDMTVDLWCLGVLTYELMVGKAPFYHISRKETMKKILNVQKQTIIYPNNMSTTAISFIKNLIKKDPQQRMKNDDILNHPFLKEAIWQLQ